MKAENILGGLDICCVRKPEKIWGGKRLQRGGECPPAPPPKCNPVVMIMCPDRFQFGVRSDYNVNVVSVGLL